VNGRGEVRARRRVTPGTILGRLVLASLIIVPIAFLYVDAKAPLDPSAPPHLLTPVQIRLMQIFPERCPAALARARNLRFTPAPREIENGCGYPDGVLITKSEISWGGPVLLRCPAAVALVMWERHALQPEARRIFGKRVSAAQTFGTYSCRNVYGREHGRRSQHATANAIDVAGFTLEGGISVSVLRDWKDQGPKGEFIRSVRDKACGKFGSVLSPDYNAAHANHLHLDMAPWMICR
jgi:hypothetical protein